MQNVEELSADKQRELLKAKILSSNIPPDKPVGNSGEVEEKITSDNVQYVAFEGDGESQESIAEGNNLPVPIADEIKKIVDDVSVEEKNLDSEKVSQDVPVSPPSTGAEGPGGEAGGAGKEPKEVRLVSPLGKWIKQPKRLVLEIRRAGRVRMNKLTPFWLRKRERDNRRLKEYRTENNLPQKGRPKKDAEVTN